MAFRSTRPRRRASGVGVYTLHSARVAELRIVDRIAHPRIKKGMAQGVCLGHSFLAPSVYHSAPGVPSPAPRLV
jgi:hypothetical protein